MIQTLIRPHLRQFQPYSSARSEAHSGNVFLDANELPYGSPVSFDGIPLNRYPDPLQKELREALAANVGVSSDMIFAGGGSDEIIDLLIRLFCDPGDSIAVLEPTYGVYRVAAEINNVNVLRIELNEKFEVEVGKTLTALSRGTKVVFLCSPNNPTGNVLRREDILRLCDSVKGIVVLDQAYVEFAPASADCTQDVIRHENLVVLRTLSKAWGLAGIRLGYCIANPEVVSYLLRIKAPYNIDAATSRLAVRALSLPDFCAASVQAIRVERARLIEALEQLPGTIRVYPSDANFLLVEFRNPRRVFEELTRNGIIVRRRSEPRLANCLRLTVGSTDENNRLLTVLEDLT